MSEATASQRVPSLVTTGLIVVSVIFPLLSFLAIFFRLKARRVARLPLHADDWWIVASGVFTLPLSINVWVFAAIIGIDFYKIDPLKGTSKSLECLLISSTVLELSLASVKISVLLFYKRIFSKGAPTFRFIVWIGIALVGCWGTIFFFLVLLQGNPIQTSWTLQGVFRFDGTALGLAQSGTSIALDIIVLASPLPIIFGLHMDLKRKVGVMFIFWLGAFCCIAAIVRLALLKQSLSLVDSSSGSGFNLVYNESKQFIFMLLEPNCSIIAACLPCYGTLFARQGGRSPESLVRSVRSVLSLRSRSSSKHSGKSWNASGPSNPTVTDHDKNAPRSESQIELSEVPENGLTHLPEA